MDNTGMVSRVEKYLANLDRLSGGVEPRFLPLDSTHDGLKGITVIYYENLPDGLSTAFTYGLSLAEHPDWIHGRPELCISVQSDDDRWGLAVGLIAERLRGSCPFSYGNTIRFGQPVTPESELTAFVVFAPSILERDDLQTDVSAPGHEGHDIIHLMGMYPIHATEQQFISEHGLEAFWKCEWDMYDTTRPPAV
jgi:suppressor of fused protein SUFU